jgi:arylsulfatase B
MKLILLAAGAGLASAAAPPHLVFNLIDDFGWANVGWHRDAGFNETVTPNMDTLVAGGVELDQYYV